MTMLFFFPPNVQPSSMLTFLQELSHTSLHPLPPLHGYLGSSHSQRLLNHYQQRSNLSTRGSQKPNMKRDMTFATMATGGSSIRDTFTSSSKDSMRFILGGAGEKMTDSMIAGHGGPDSELDIMMMDSEVPSRRGLCDAQVNPSPHPPHKPLPPRLNHPHYKTKMDSTLTTF